MFTPGMIPKAMTLLEFPPELRVSAAKILFGLYPALENDTNPGKVNLDMAVPGEGYYARTCIGHKGAIYWWDDGPPNQGCWRKLEKSPCSST